MLDKPDMGPLVADPMLPRRFRVTEAWRELDDVMSLSLAPVDGDPISFAAGQFNMLYAFGVGEAAISISGDPTREGELIHTIRNVGAVSAALTDVTPGDMVGLRGPFGAGWPVAEQKGRHLVFLAGGLGLAPLRPALLQAIHASKDYAGITVLVGARSPRDILYAYELADWASQDGMALHVTVDHAAPGWTGVVGVVTTRIEKALNGRDPAQVSAFVCGPEIMMRYGGLALADAGVPVDRIWASMERNMKCAVGLCGHCQYGPDFVCKDGPVFRHDQLVQRMRLREI